MQKYKLREIANITAGQSAPQGAQEFSSEGTPFIRAGSLIDLINGKTEDEFELVSEEVAKKHKLKLQSKDTILFAKSGMSCMKGYVYKLKKPCYVVSHLACIKSNDNVFPNYLKYYFDYNRPNKLVKDESYPSISLDDIKSLDILLPLFPEQRCIAEELDKACSAIEKQKKQLALCEELIKSKFHEMFGNPVINDKGWDVKSLNEICDVRDGTHDSPKYVSEGYPLITSKNVSSGFLDFSQVNLISKEDYDNINKRSKVDLGDILMPMIGTIGKPIIVNIKPFFAIKNMALIKFSKTNIINIYIFSLLSSEFLKIKANDQMKGGTQKFMSLGTIRALKIPIPPLPLQQQFADFVNEVEKTKLKMKESLTKTETLYKALMQKYFEKGESA